MQKTKINIMNILVQNALFSMKNRHRSACDDYYLCSFSYYANLPFLCNRISSDSPAINRFPPCIPYVGRASMEIVQVLQKNNTHTHIHIYIRQTVSSDRGEYGKVSFCGAQNPHTLTHTGAIEIESVIKGEKRSNKYGPGSDRTTATHTAYTTEDKDERRATEQIYTNPFQMASGAPVFAR